MTIVRTPTAVTSTTSPPEMTDITVIMIITATTRTWLPTFGDASGSRWF